MRTKLSVLTLAVLAGVAAAQPAYEAVVVDAFVTTYSLRETYFWDISDDGRAVGLTTIARSVPGGTSITYTGFFWDPVADKVEVPLSLPKSVNNTGWIGGSPGLYLVGSGQATVLALPPSMHAPMEVLGLNDAGVSVGYVQACSCSNSQGLLFRPCVWDAQHQPTLLPVPGATRALRVNNAGQVVGWIGGNGGGDGFVYDLNSGQYVVMSSVFSGPPAWTSSTDISDSGVVVGSRRSADGLTLAAYTWAGAGEPALLPLPAPPYRPEVRAAAISNNGVVVGDIFMPDGSSRGAVYTPGGEFRDLNTLATLPPGFVITHASQVNDRGWIAGWGQGGGGFSKGVILKPLPAGCYADCNSDGVLNLADFGCFQTAFALGSADADCNGDGLLNLSDFGCFQTRFALGCP